MNIILRGATLINGRGDPPLPHANVLIEGERITAVGKDGSFQPPSDAEVIELNGKWLLPGLIDLHSHMYFINPLLDVPRVEPDAYAALVAARTLRTNLLAGVTTVRDLAVQNRISLSLRKAVREGVTVGSRVFACGLYICQTGGHGSEYHGCAREANGVADVRQAVREEWKAGADLIKVCLNGYSNAVEFSLEELQALVDEAHRLNLKVACHASVLPAAQNAVLAGVDTIEHGCHLDEATAQEMADKGIIFVPTGAIYLAALKSQRDGSNPPSQAARSLEMRVALHRQSVELALRAGVTMGAGTDWVFPDRSYIAMADELAFLVSCGLSPMQALQAATVVGAEALGESSRLGTIEVGKLADVFAVDGDPIADIRAVSQTVMVMQAGKVVRP